MSKASICLVVLVSAVASAWPGSAFAHIKLKSPMSRDPNTELKDPPCGPSASTRGTTMTMLTSGQKLMVEWDETIEHPGHYRIAFDSDGQDFPDPKSFTDMATAGADLGNGVTVLVDGITDVRGQLFTATPYKVEITLPDIECNNCTLQLIQVMTDKSPYGNGDDIYHECANLVLKKSAGAAAGSGGMTAAGTGAVAGAGAGTGAGTGAGAAAGAGAAGTGASGTGASGTGAAGGASGSSGAAGRLAAGTGAGAAGSGAAGMVAGAAGAAPTPTGMMTNAQMGAAGSAIAMAGAPAMPTASEGCSVTGVGARSDRTPLFIGLLAVAAGAFQRLRSRSRSSRFRGRP